MWDGETIQTKKKEKKNKPKDGQSTALSAMITDKSTTSGYDAWGGSRLKLLEHLT